uniref:Uncharacterized protein n=1 Tax=Romanomermis culicivorax TaxID=13658 RepID=A0A915IKR1_ROMCU
MSTPQSFDQYYTARVAVLPSICNQHCWRDALKRVPLICRAWSSHNRTIPFRMTTTPWFVRRPGTNFTVYAEGYDREDTGIIVQ